MPLRLWPGVLVVVLQWVAWFVVPIFVPEAGPFGVVGALLGGLAIVVWLTFYSRAPRSERWGAVVLMVVVALVATSRILHASIATAGMGLLFFMYAMPVLSLAFVVWAMVSQRLADGPRLAAMVATILLACGAWTLVRSDGITGDGAAEFAWRWSETPEARLLAQVGDEPTALPSAPAAKRTKAEWPGFRGPGRDGSISGMRIETDWSRSPPVELWRRPIGPGISSFAVHGDLFYTQEQRGDDEIVASYNVTTGEPVWRHGDPARFWDSHAGAGPRSTPTLSDGRVYTFGATGLLNALVAYDLATGDPRWFGPDGGAGYSSPHLFTIDGVAQILLMSAAGMTSLAPADGTLLWEHSWPGAPIVQPALTADGDLLMSTATAAGGAGMRRLAVAHGADRVLPHLFVRHRAH